MPGDRDRPQRPKSGIPVEFPDEETTGQHVRVQLVDLKNEIRNYAEQDQRDHRHMISSGDERHRRLSAKIDDQGKEIAAVKLGQVRLEGQVGTLGSQIEGVEGSLSGQLSGMKTAVDTLASTLASTLGNQQATSHLRLVATTAIDVAEKKAEIDDRKDVRSKRRDIYYGVLKAIAIVVATYLFTKITGL